MSSDLQKLHQPKGQSSAQEGAQPCRPPCLRSDTILVRVFGDLRERWFSTPVCIRYFARRTGACSKWRDQICRTDSAHSGDI
jgi:hypothetical protein